MTSSPLLPTSNTWWTNSKLLLLDPRKKWFTFLPELHIWKANYGLFRQMFERYFSGNKYKENIWFVVAALWFFFFFFGLMPAFLEVGKRFYWQTICLKHFSRAASDQTRFLPSRRAAAAASARARTAVCNWWAVSLENDFCKTASLLQNKSSTLKSFKHTSTAIQSPEGCRCLFLLRNNLRSGKKWFFRTKVVLKCQINLHVAVWTMKLLFHKRAH